MKTAITPTYTFNPAAGTLNLSGISNFNIAMLYEVINETTGQTIYEAGIQGLGYSSLTGTTLTLKANMAGMSAGDSLQIIYEVNASGSSSGTSSNPVSSFRQTVTTSAAALPNDTFATGVEITAPSSNAGTVYIGGSGVTTASGFPLAPGASISYSVANSNQLYVIGTNSTDIVVGTGN